MKFDEYLDKSTKKIFEIISASKVSDEEKRSIVLSITDELAKHIGEIDRQNNYESIIYGASLKYIENKTLSIMNSSNASYSEYEAAIELCNRKKAILELFKSNNWVLPISTITDTDQCIFTIRHKQESISISDKIIEEDERLSDMIHRAESQLDVGYCDTALNILNALEQDISLCRAKNVNIPQINHLNTNKAREYINNIRSNAMRKENIYSEMRSIDLQIGNIESLSDSTPDRWQQCIEMCQKQTNFIAQCNSERFGLPQLRYSNLGNISNKYSHYFRMFNLDRTLSSDKETLSSSRQYNSFIDKCTEQIHNIETCKRNGWNCPQLLIDNPDALINKLKNDMKRKEGAKKAKKVLIILGVIAIAIIALVIFIIYKFREGKVQIPFSPSYVDGLSCEDVQNELTKAGFTDITLKYDYSGWQESNIVVSVSIDNTEKYNKGDYIKPDVNVTITSSSLDRKYVTDTLQNWQTSDYESVVKKLKKEGFNNITVNSEDTFEKSNDKHIASLILNEKEYSGEQCYLPPTSSIVITYYDYKIGIGSTNSQFVGQNYEGVVSRLKESGFTNVEAVKIDSGWAKGDTIVSVTVNNLDTYKSSDSFSPNTKIIVNYSSNDRIDASSIFKNWKNKNYEDVVNELKTKGFTNVMTAKQTTDNKNLNLLASTITIGTEEFTSGDCYIQSNKLIVVDYYLLKIKIGEKASSFKGKEWSEVVGKLKDLGFTNIQVAKSNDLINGWVNKENTVREFTINDSSDFNENDEFYYNDKVYVLVNTVADRVYPDLDAQIIANN